MIRTQDGYRAILLEEPDRMIRMDADRSVSEIHNTIISHLKGDLHYETHFLQSSMTRQPALMAEAQPAGYRVTKLNSSGGFLRSGNTTLMIVVEEAQMEEVLGIIRKFSSSRQAAINTNVTPSSMGGSYIPYPVEVIGWRRHCLCPQRRIFREDVTWVLLPLSDSLT